MTQTTMHHQYTPQDMEPQTQPCHHERYHKIHKSFLRVGRRTINSLLNGTGNTILASIKLRANRAILLLSLALVLFSLFVRNRRFSSN